MQVLKNLIFGNTYLHYIQEGFSDEQAQAMQWMAKQKTYGKLFGFNFGLFMAFCWGHWHHRLAATIKLPFSKLFSQCLIVFGSTVCFDYAYSVRRKGAIGDYWSNLLMLNNNLLYSNLDSLAQNYSILNRKFTENEYKAFNDRRQNRRSNIKNRKWIFNEHIITPELFQRRIKVNTEGVWADKGIVNQIKAKYAGKEDLTIAPVNLKQLLDVSGLKFDTPTERHRDWTPMRK